jgi:hypothetical protein
LKNNRPTWVIDKLMQMIPSEQQIPSNPPLFCSYVERWVKEMDKLVPVNTKLSECFEGLLVNWLGF